MEAVLSKNTPIAQAAQIGDPQSKNESTAGKRTPQKSKIGCKTPSQHACTKNKIVAPSLASSSKERTVTEDRTLLLHTGRDHPAGSAKASHQRHIALQAAGNGPAAPGCSGIWRVVGVDLARFAGA